jgi:alpha-beta hydrolase superfamily lysophospholipase
VAASLPAGLPVLVLHGGKDEQVSAAHIDHLMEGFAAAGNEAVTRVDLPDANHLLKVIDGEPNAALDYANPDLPFSPDAIAAIEAFLQQHDLAR